jgi:hypothetical protein
MDERIDSLGKDTREKSQRGCEFFIAAMFVAALILIIFSLELTKTTMTTWLLKEGALILAEKQRFKRSLHGPMSQRSGNRVKATESWELNTASALR